MQVCSKIGRCIRSRQTLTGVQVIQPILNIPLIYMALTNLDNYRNRPTYKPMQGKLISSTSTSYDSCPLITNGQDLLSLLDAISLQYFESITYIFVSFVLLISFLWNFAKLLSDFLDRRNYKSLYQYVGLIQMMISIELLAVWVTLAFSALSYPVNGYTYDQCVSGGTFDQRLLFVDRYSAFIFLNVEACLAPLVVPLAALLLVQLQKNREQQLLRFQQHQRDINPINPLCMLLCHLVAMIIICTTMYFIFSTANPILIILTLLNCIMHIFQFVHMKQIIKHIHQKQLQNTEEVKPQQAVNQPIPNSGKANQGFIKAGQTKYRGVDMHRGDFSSISEAVTLQRNKPRTSISPKQKTVPSQKIIEFEQYE